MPLAAIMLMALSSQGDAGSGEPVRVSMTSRDRFEPPIIHARVGQPVRWINTSTSSHTVTVGGARWPADTELPRGAKPFDSGPIGISGSFEHTFDVPGTYRYVCTLHEPMGMIGTVVVAP